MADLILNRRRLILNQPHPVTLTGGVLTFTTDIAGKMQVSAPAGSTVIVAGTQLFDKNNVTPSALIDSNGVEKESSKGWWQVSDYIRVDGLESIFYKGLTDVGTSPYSAWYDSNKDLLSGGVFKQATGENTLTVPNGACYVRFSIIHQSPKFDETEFYVTASDSTDYASYSGSTDPVSKAGFNTVFADSGTITITYWTY